MAFEYLTNVPLTQAREDYLAFLQERGFAPRTETVAVRDACGRTTARRCTPPFARPITRLQPWTGSPCAPGTPSAPQRRRP